MKRWYLGGVASWFLPQGMMSVLVPWLVGEYLQLEGARYFGYAYLVFTLPMVLCVLLGGWVADRYDERRVLLLSQASLGVLAFLLGLVTWSGALTYPMLLAYLCCVGTATAFVRPARDALVATVAGHAIQRLVTASTGVQFGVQVLGFALAGWVEVLGAGLMFKVMGVVLLGGAIAARRLPASPVRAAVSEGRLAPWKHVFAEPLRALRTAPGLTHVAVINVITGLCFNGAYYVIVPSLILALDDTGAGDLAVANTAFMLATLASTLVLLRRPGIFRRQVSNLVISIGLNAAALAFIAAVPSMIGIVLGMAIWGAGTGVAISLGRTIVQERAPAELRARLLAIYMLTFMGGTPVGSLALGLLAERIGAPAAGVVASMAIWAVLALLVWVTDVRAADAPPVGRSDGSGPQEAAGHV